MADSYAFGAVRTAEELSIIKACEDVIVAFCDRIDVGDVEGAVDLHTENVLFYDVGAVEPMRGKSPILKRMLKVRFCYPNRVTLHTVHNVRFGRVTTTEAECRFMIGLYDLVAVEGKSGIGSKSTEFLGFAEEHVQFSADGDLWKFCQRKVRFLSGAKALPIGVLPSSLPFGEEEK